MAELIVWCIVVAFGTGLAAGRLFARIQQRRTDRRRAARLENHVKAGLIGVVLVSAPRTPQAVRREVARG